MSLIPGDEQHFARWVAAHRATTDDPEAVTGQVDVYPRRAVFGRYIADQVAPLVAQGNIRHVRERVVSITREGGLAPDDGYGCELSRHRHRSGNDASQALISRPNWQALHPDPRVVSDPLDPKALERISPDARVLIVGTGLTMADVVATLDKSGHRGPITAISRRGLRSHGHPAVAADPYGTFTAVPGTPSQPRAPHSRARPRTHPARASLGRRFSTPCAATPRACGRL